jgi:DNA-binding MarR family transcriptional regulator
MTHAVQSLSGGSLLHQLARDMTTTLDRRFSPFGLTTQQAALLLTAGSGQSSPRQIAEAIGTDTAGMTKLLDRLEGKRLVRRRPNPADRRSVLVEPTELGLALVPKLVPVFGEVAKQLFEGFSDAEITQFTSSLRRMRENLQP